MENATIVYNCRFIACMLMFLCRMLIWCWFALYGIANSTTCYRHGRLDWRHWHIRTPVMSG